MLKVRKENNISSGFRIKNALYNKEHKFIAKV